MKAITGSAATVIEAIADEAAAMLAEVEAWAAINSGSRNLDGLARMADVLADAFSVLPGEMHLVNAMPVEAIDKTGCPYMVEHGRHLHLAVRPDAPLQLLFTGHMDTVFGADHPFQKLKWLESGILNGPGVADMKGGLSVMRAALRAVEASPLAAGLGYEVLINSDEEVGSGGSAALIARAAAGKHAAFTYEPALADGTLAGARPGSGNFALVVRGRSAHAGRNPEEGRNALLAAAGLALRLADAAGHGLTVNPARIEGGSPNNVVPDHAVLYVNFRPRTDADERRAQSVIDAAAAEVAAVHEVAIAVHGGFGRPPKPLDANQLRLFSHVRACGAELGLDIHWRDSGGVCDGNNIAACGVPVVDSMGVRGGAIHSPDEFLIVDSLVERAQLSALAVLRLIERGLQ